MGTREERYSTFGDFRQNRKKENLKTVLTCARNNRTPVFHKNQKSRKFQKSFFFFN